MWNYWDTKTLSKIFKLIWAWEKMCCKTSNLLSRTYILQSMLFRVSSFIVAKLSYIFNGESDNFYESNIFISLIVDTYEVS